MKDLWDNLKHANLCLIEIPEGKEKLKGTENICKAIMATNFQNLGREIEISYAVSLNKV